MTHILPNLVFAIVVLGLAGFWVWQDRRQNRRGIENDCELVRGFWDCLNFDLAGRIFDAEDYHWLRDEIEFPKLAATLLRDRTNLALRWLRALRSSFNELVRTAQPHDAEQGSDSGSWTLLFMTLRFQILSGYALFVVRVFGPYHRLVPSCGWLRAVAELRVRKAPFGLADTGGLS